MRIFEFSEKLAKLLINNSYINDETSVCPEKPGNISHILETAPTHATDYDKKGFALKNINTNNISVISQNVKK